MTNTDLKNKIDLEITNKVLPQSITPSNVGQNLKDIVDYIDQEVEENLPAVLIGPQGETGPVGPVGPAGLEWQGLWVDTSDYNLNDAVSYNGSSYFCINAIEGDPANQDPETDTTTWAFLAMRGTPGSPGPMGPQGPPGPSSSPVKTFGNIEATLLSEQGYPVISTDICLVLSQGNGRRVVLPQSQPVGKEVILYAGNTNFSFLVQNAQVSTPGLSPEGIQSYVSSFEIRPNRNYKFTSLGGDNFWKIEELTINKKVIFKARLTQVGTNNPVVTVLENLTGRTYSVIRVDVGHYRITPTIALPTTIDFRLNFNTNSFIAPSYNSENQVNNLEIFTRYWNGSDFVLSDDIINRAVLELEII
jgi:hypothetical protein